MLNIRAICYIYTGCMLHKRAIYICYIYGLYVTYTGCVLHIRAVCYIYGPCYIYGLYFTHTGSGVCVCVCVCVCVFVFTDLWGQEPEYTLICVDT
jgi:hypothetical protein